MSFITEPNAPPDNVTKLNTSSTSIVVQWDHVPPADQNGVILSYTVTYRALGDMLEKTELVPAPTRAATLTGLKKYTNYSITVFASTSKGGGNKSAPIIVITDEDSKFIQHLFPSSAYYQKQYFFCMIISPFLCKKSSHEKSKFLLSGHLFLDTARFSHYSSQIYSFDPFFQD